MSFDSNFTVYIDEGGDPGVTDGLHYRDLPHQWMTMGAFVVRTSEESNVVGWVTDIRKSANIIQGKSLHYHKLGSHRRLQVCKKIDQLPARAFCFASHKDNLRSYINPRMGKMTAGEYYNWCSRLLLERVMFWAEYRQRLDGLSRKPLRIIFSKKGGQNYEKMFDYFEYVNWQMRHGKITKKPKCWVPELITKEMISYQPDHSLAGLQLADAVASSFHDALNLNATAHSLDPAKALFKVVARDHKHRKVDCGITVWPLNYQAKIKPENRPIFEYYGYQFE